MLRVALDTWYDVYMMKQLHPSTQEAMHDARKDDPEFFQQLDDAGWEAARLADEGMGPDSH